VVRICQTLPVRRSLAGLLLIISAVLFAVSISAWWLQRVAFSPSAGTDTTLAILGDEAIRGEIATIVASATAPATSQSPTQLKEFIEDIARIPAGAALMTDFVSQAHQRLIGDRGEPVRINAEQQVQIVRDERVGEMDPITLPVQEVGALSVIDAIAGWIALGGALLGLLLLVAAVIIRPERGEFTLALAIGLAALAVSILLLGYVVPATMLPALSDSNWMGVFPRLANDSLLATIGIAVGALVLAAAITLGTSSLRQRRQWSTPLSVGRYRDDRSWSTR
jgi:hypothetical protein